MAQTVSAVVLPPLGIKSMSMAIFDAAGAFRCWTWHLGPFGNGTLTPNMPNTTSVLTKAAGVGAPADATPAADKYLDIGINPTQITMFGWDENGNWVNFTQVVPGKLQQKPRNYWYSVTVTHEPLSMGFLSLALLARGIPRRRM